MFPSFPRALNIVMLIMVILICLAIQHSKLIKKYTNHYLISDQPQGLHLMSLNCLLSHLQNENSMPE